MDKKIQRTIANFQQKVDLQEQLLSTYRYQLEKQKDEIAGLKITIETQRIELQSNVNRNPKGSPLVEKIQAQLDEAQAYAVNLNAHVEKEAAEKQHLVEAILESSRKVQLDWERVKKENLELQQKLSSLQQKYDSAIRKNYNLEGYRSFIPQEPGIVVERHKQSGSDIVFSPGFKGNKDAEFKLRQSARKVDKHLRQLFTPPSTGRLASLSDSIFTPKNKIFEKSFGQSTNGLEEFNQTTRKIEFMVPSPTGEKAANVRNKKITTGTKSAAEEKGSNTFVKSEVIPSSAHNVVENSWGNAAFAIDQIL